MRDLSSGVQRRQHRRPRRARLAPGAVVHAVAGHEREDLVQRRGLPGDHRSLQEPRPRWTGSPEAPRRRASGRLGLPARPRDRRHRAHASPPDARAVRRRHSHMGRRGSALSRESLSPEVVMETYKLSVNGQQNGGTVDPVTPLLWVLLEELKITVSKYGCGIAACGACTVHLGGIATRSCVVPVSLVGARPLVTIAAMAADPAVLT